MNQTRRTAVAERMVVAESFVARMRGLLGRSGLEQNEGMLFKDCRSIHTWFMRFPIDALFLDRSDMVVCTHQNLRPFRTAGHWRAASVLELPAGTIAATGTQPGDRLSIR